LIENVFAAESTTSRLLVRSMAQVLCSGSGPLLIRTTAVSGNVLPFNIVNAYDPSNFGGIGEFESRQLAASNNAQTATLISDFLEGVTNASSVRGRSGRAYGFGVVAVHEFVGDVDHGYLNVLQTLAVTTIRMAIIRLGMRVPFST
jgi:hypothetical protein